MKTLKGKAAEPKIAAAVGLAGSTPKGSADVLLKAALLKATSEAVAGCHRDGIDLASPEAVARVKAAHAKVLAEAEEKQRELVKVSVDQQRGRKLGGKKQKTEADKRHAPWLKIAAAVQRKHPTYTWWRVAGEIAPRYGVTQPTVFRVIKFLPRIP